MKNTLKNKSKKEKCQKNKYYMKKKLYRLQRNR